MTRVRRSGRRTHRTIALTGTPGTGKSRVAEALRATWRVAEVGDLARRAGAARGAGRRVEVDLARLRRWMIAHPEERPDLLVGHLAHLLPVDAAIVLRCRPIELRRRLDRAHRGRASDRRANMVAEAIDVVLREAIDAGRPVWEIDTTSAPVGRVARHVVRLLRARPARSRHAVDWLADPVVTAYLLDPTP